ncbi:MAG: hypoxanthine phosphoribosyltransferase [Actinomycetota bacterium]
MLEGCTTLFTAEQIRQRVAELGREIAADYVDRRPILIAVLRGSSVFLADLIREIAVPVEIDFMSISSYGGGGDKGGRVRIIKDLEEDIGDRDVILVEDIIDTGLTVNYLVSALRSRSPRTVEVCALLDKSVRRIAPLPVRYVGFDCPDRFVIGYGLDYEQRYRNLEAILTVDDLDAIAEGPPLEGEPGSP